MSVSCLLSESECCNMSHNYSGHNLLYSTFPFGQQKYIERSCWGIDTDEITSLLQGLSALLASSKTDEKI